MISHLLSSPLAAQHVASLHSLYARRGSESIIKEKCTFFREFVTIAYSNTGANVIKLTFLYACSVTWNGNRSSKELRTNDNKRGSVWHLALTTSEETVVANWLLLAETRATATTRWTRRLPFADGMRMEKFSIVFVQKAGINTVIDKNSARKVEFLQYSSEIGRVFFHNFLLNAIKHRAKDTHIKLY